MPLGRIRNSWSRASPTKSVSKSTCSPPTATRTDRSNQSCSSACPPLVNVMTGGASLSCRSQSSSGSITDTPRSSSAGTTVLKKWIIASPPSTDSARLGMPAAAHLDHPLPAQPQMMAAFSAQRRGQGRSTDHRQAHGGSGRRHLKLPGQAGVELGEEPVLLLARNLDARRRQDLARSTGIPSICTTACSDRSPSTRSTCIDTRGGWRATTTGGAFLPYCTSGRPDSCASASRSQIRRLPNSSRKRFVPAPPP
jgi:hypothetical protein